MNDEVQMNEISAPLSNLFKEMEDELQEFIILGRADLTSGIRLRIRNEYNDGAYAISNDMMDSFPLEKGRNFTEYELNSEALVAVSCNLYDVGTVVEVAGREYEIVGNIACSEEQAIYVSPSAVPSDYPLTGICFVFKKYPSQKEFEQFVEEFEAAVGLDRVEFSEFEAIDNEKIIAMKSVVIISVIIGMIAALDTALLYRYIMDKRKKQMAIMGIVGAKRVHRILINEAEVMIITIMTVVVGFLLFKFIFEGLIQKIYENMIEIYYSKVYLMMLGIYVGSMFLVTVILTILSSGNDFLKLKKGTK